MNAAIKIHIHFLITNHSNLSHLLPSFSVWREKCMCGPSLLEQRHILLREEACLCAILHGACLFVGLSYEGSRSGSEAII